MYSVHLSAEAQPQVDALPAEALAAFAELRVVLETAPWNGRPWVRENPGGALRVQDLAGAGFVVYVVLEQQRRVEVVRVIWAGRLKRSTSSTTCGWAKNFAPRNHDHLTASLTAKRSRTGSIPAVRVDRGAK